MNMLNSIILEGNIIKVGNAVESVGFKHMEVTISVERKFQNRAGDTVDETSEFDIIAYGVMVDTLSRKAEIGQGIRVVGRLKQQTWKDGDKDCSRVVVIAEHIEYKPKKSQKKETENEKSVL